MKCLIDACENNVLARGLCGKHYERYRQHGNPLTAKFIPAKPGEPRKFLDDLPIEGEGCVYWPFAKNNRGYGQVNTGSGKKTLAHRISCERANGAAPSVYHQAAHSCGNGHLGCVAPWHLEWKTPAENCADKKVHGTHIEGADHPQSKLSSEDRRLIATLSGEVSHASIADRLGVSQTLVSQIARGVKPGGKAMIKRKLPASGIRGVRQMPNGKWQARIAKNKKHHHLGTFGTKDAAAAAVLDWIAAQIGVTPEDLKNGRAA